MLQAGLVSDRIEVSVQADPPGLGGMKRYRLSLEGITEESLPAVEDSGSVDVHTDYLK